MKNGHFEPLTAEAMMEFCGRAPARSVRGFAYVQDGHPLAIFGMERYQDGWLAFLNRHPRAPTGIRARRLIALGLRKLSAVMRETNAPIYADADQRFDGACELLERMGFHRQSDGRFKWEA